MDPICFIWILKVNLKSSSYLVQIVIITSYIGTQVIIQLLFHLNIRRDLLENRAAERILSLVLQVLTNQRRYMQKTVRRLTIILFLHMNRGHRIQPDTPQLNTIAIRLGQTILRINQHFRILLEVLHLARGLQDILNPLRQILDFNGQTTYLICLVADG